MKKRFVALAMLPLALAVLAAALLLPRAQAPVSAITDSGERDFLSAELTYDAGTRTLRGSQKMTLTNRTGETLSHVVLRLDMNGENEKAVAVSSLKIGGQDVTFAQDEENPCVLRAAYDWAAGETIEVSMTVMVKHEKASGAAAVMLPAPAVYENGVWREDGYDALAEGGYAQAFDYTVTLDGEGYAQMRGAREVCFALYPGGKTRQKQVGDTQIKAMAGSAGDARRLLALTENALRSLESLGFPYPFETLTVAEGETGRTDGLSLSGLIVLAPDGEQETRLRRLTRAVARQTFGVLVESDPWNAPWLSHSLASAAELLGYRARKGEAAYETRYFDEVDIATRLTRPAGVTVGAGTAFFGSDAEMTQVLRDQGAAMLLGIEQAVGEEAFLDALKRYVSGNAGRIAGQQELEAALLAATGSDWSGYLADELFF